MNKIYLFLSAVCFSNSTTPSTAQSVPKYDLSNHQPGAAYTWESSEGFIEGENLGFLGETYVFSTILHALDGTLVYSRRGLSKTGQMEWFENNFTSYYLRPHDCSFVSHPCEAQLISNTRLLAEISVKTRYADNIWTHVETTFFPSNQEITTIYCGVYDENSITIALYTIDDTGYEFWQRITSGPHADRSKAILSDVTTACQQLRLNS